MSILDNRIISGDMSSTTADAVEKMIERVRQLRPANVDTGGGNGAQPQRVEIGELWIRGHTGGSNSAQ